MTGIGPKGDLKVEESISWISGVDVQLYEWISVDLDFTRFLSKNMIRWIPADGSNYYPFNLDKAEGNILALKAGLEWTWGEVNGGVTYQRVLENGAQMRYVPEFMGTFLLVLRPVNDLRIFAGNIFESDRPLVDGGLESGNILDRYNTLDIGLDYRWHFMLMKIVVNNITDEQYRLQSELPMKGINYEMSITFEF